jgi:antitoxin HicB
MYTYPVTLTDDDNGTVLVGFRDLPWVHTFGEDETEALKHAVDALESAFIAIIAEREPVPRASKVGRGGKSVTLPALSAAKVALYEAMREEGLRKTDLARRLGWHMPQVDRLLDLRHASRMDQIETALHSLGRTLVVVVKPAA